MTKRTRRFLLFGLLAGALALGACVWLVWPAPSPISWVNNQKIHEGMSLSEVEAVLGGPARRDTTRPFSVCFTGHRGTADPTKEWVSDEIWIMVYLDADNRVQHHDAVAVMRESLFDRICRWLGL